MRTPGDNLNRVLRNMARRTIDDVAKAAGVAIKTVSRVLNNEPNVRDEMRARVQAVVKALDRRAHQLVCRESAGPAPASS